MRLFLALALDQTARADLYAGVEAARRALGEAGRAFRWTAPGNLHVTLHFLGSVDEAGLGRLRDVFHAPLDLEPVDLGTGHWGRFPGSGPPAVLWVAVERGADQVRAVYELLGARLRHAGFTTETRPFTPHITVARVRSRERGRVRRLPRLPDPTVVGWRVAEATLFESELGESPPRYRPVLRVPLA